MIETGIINAKNARKTMISGGGDFRVVRAKIFTQDRYSTIVAIRDLDRGRDRVEIAFTVIPG